MAGSRLEASNHRARGLKLASPWRRASTIVVAPIPAAMAAAATSEGVGIPARRNHRITRLTQAAAQARTLGARGRRPPGIVPASFPGRDGDQTRPLNVTRDPTLDASARGGGAHVGD